MNVPNTASYGSLAGETIYGINTFAALLHRARRLESPFCLGPNNF